MKIALLTNIISPHQIPLAKAIVDFVGENNYRYVYTESFHDERSQMGWGDSVDRAWCRKSSMDDPSLHTADILISGHRALDLFEKRNAAGLKTFYASERWFKPPFGMLRLLSPGYFRMAWRFVKCLRRDCFSLLPMGIHAARDFIRLIKLFRGDLRCLFCAPKVAFESRPGGVIVPLNEAIRAGGLSKEDIAFGQKHGFVQIPREHWNKLTPSGAFAKMQMWGYFMAPGDAKATRRSLPIEHSPLRILWAGRMLDLKRADVLVRAASPHPDLKRVDVSLHLYGDGSMRQKLRKLARGATNVEFHNFVSIEKVRQLMREHDVYVLSSNGYEGWGAVVSEALEEGMKVLGTIEAGATATILPLGNLFKAGDVKRLRELLGTEIRDVGIGCWTAEYAARTLLEL